MSSNLPAGWDGRRRPTPGRQLWGQLGEDGAGGGRRRRQVVVVGGGGGRPVLLLAQHHSWFEG